MAFLAALPEVAEAGAAGEAGGAAGGGMLGRLPLVGNLLGGRKGGGDKSNSEAAMQMAHEALGNLNARQFG